MTRLYAFLILLSVGFTVGCANIVPPDGGDKDTTPPKLLVIEPQDSLLNTRVTSITLRFDEFVEVKDASTEVQVSPVLPYPLSVTSIGKKVKVLIPDSLLKENTTYRVSFGKAIVDLHEQNPFEGYTYTFSTGGYFDSLQLSGIVVDAATGTTMDDINVVLHYADECDSSIVRKKPAYVVRTSSGGKFSLSGLPAKRFRIYALKDENGNLIFDGGQEKVAFVDTTYMPTTADSAQQIVLLLFRENVLDSLTALSQDKGVIAGKGRSDRSARKNEVLSYRVDVDTANKDKRTHDVKLPLNIVFTQDTFKYDAERIFVSYDSAGADIEVDHQVWLDSGNKQVMNIFVSWKQNVLYTVRLLPGFASDTAGNNVPPSKYIFRTKDDDDYGKLQVKVPASYLDNKYVLLVKGDKDTVYSKPIIDTLVNLTLLDPGKYKVYIIVDENHNGKWDPGILLERVQPEIVIPHNTEVTLKAGWENVENFTPSGVYAPKAVSPNKRDATTEN